MLAIGDIHGCWAEFEEMLQKLQPSDDDLVLLLGDLVNRGPDSHKVVQRAREIGAHALLGNHEWRLLCYRRLGDPAPLKPFDLTTLRGLDEEDWAYIEKMTLTCHLPAHDTVFVHGGFLPNRPWQEQTVSVVTEIQVVDAHGEARRRGENPQSPHWSDLWTGPPFVVYGHTPRREIKRTPMTLGIDTACVHGGKLTAYILPDRELVQVPARRAYEPKRFPTP